MAISSRDFVEKTFTFYEKGKLYRFTCSLPNSAEKGPNGEAPFYELPDASTVRGFTNIVASIFYRNPTDGKIIF